MKRLIALSLAFYSFQALSQIAVNSWDYIGPSEIISMATDENPNIEHTASGPNQTWNYGELSNSVVYSVAFAPLQWYAGYQNFPTANFGVDDEETNIFFRKSNEAFDIVGLYADLIGDGNVVATPFMPYQREVTFPITYGQTWDNVSVLKLKTTNMAEFGGIGDSLVVTVTTHRTAEVDAWGTITTPLGTFPTLRLHLKDSTIESFAVFSFGFPIVQESENEVLHTYTFISNSTNAKYNLVRYNYNEDSQSVGNVEWQMAAPIVSNGPEYKFDQPELFPNPSESDFQISNLHIGDQVSITAMNGQRVGDYTVSDKNMKFEIDGLANGTYVVLIRGPHGAFMRKLSVQK